MSHPTGPRVGEQFGPYLLRRLLGSGGFGEVYEAEDTTMQRVVALKVLNSSYSHNPAFRERLFREARAAGRLHDPHVVPVHSCGEINGQLYIDMRLIDGTDLQDVLDRGGPLAPTRAAAIARQIAAALDAAHAQQVIHRDIKPANILLGRDDFACLVDFGLANAATDTKITTEGTTLGSFSYLAPERLSAGHVTPGADIYALACVLYECLTGSPPYRREEIPALIAAHLAAPVPRPSQQRPGIPAGFDEVIARGMAKRPEDRYRSAGELAAAAGRALTTAPPHLARPPQPAPATAPWRHPGPPPPTGPAPLAPTGPPRRGPRRRTALVLAAIAVVAVVVVAVAVGIARHSTPTRAAPSTSTTAASGTTSSISATPTTPSTPSAPLPALNATPLPLKGSGDLGGVAVDKDGSVYVVDGTNSRVLKLAAGAPAPSELPFHGLASPKKVAVDAAGDVFVTDWSHDGKGRVLKLAAGTAAQTVLPFGNVVPTGIAIDSAGNVYASATDRILELAGGAASPTELPFGASYYRAIAVDGAGNVFAAELNQVVKLAVGAAGPALLPFAQLGSARDLAVDAQGNVYAVDDGDGMGRVVKLPAGATSSIQLFAPERQELGGIALDAAGNVYLTENTRLLKVAAG